MPKGDKYYNFLGRVRLIDQVLGAREMQFRKANRVGELKAFVEALGRDPWAQQWGLSKVGLARACGISRHHFDDYMKGRNRQTIENLSLRMSPVLDAIDYGTLCFIEHTPIWIEPQPHVQQPKIVTFRKFQRDWQYWGICCGCFRRRYILTAGGLAVCSRCIPDLRTIGDTLAPRGERLHVPMEAIRAFRAA